jgi:ribonucleoside-diphosphate reductase beta chain
MAEALKLETTFIKDCLPQSIVGMTQKEIIDYINYVGNSRLISVGLEPLVPGLTNPLKWMDEIIFIKKEQNFFEGRVTEYQKASSLTRTSNDDL